MISATSMFDWRVLPAPSTIYKRKPSVGSRTDTTLQPHLRHLKKSECAMLGRTRHPFSFYGLNSDKFPVYMWFFARSTGIPLTTFSGRDTTGRTLDGGQLCSC